MADSQRVARTKRLYWRRRAKESRCEYESHWNCDDDDDEQSSLARVFVAHAQPTASASPVAGCATFDDAAVASPGKPSWLSSERTKSLTAHSKRTFSAAAIVAPGNSLNGDVDQNKRTSGEVGEPLVAATATEIKTVAVLCDNAAANSDSGAGYGVERALQYADLNSLDAAAWANREKRLSLFAQALDKLHAQRQAAHTDSCCLSQLRRAEADGRWWSCMIGFHSVTLPTAGLGDFMAHIASQVDCSVEAAVCAWIYIERVSALDESGGGSGGSRSKAGDGEGDSKRGSSSNGGDIKCGGGGGGGGSRESRVVNPHTTHRLLLTAMYLAAKFNDDCTIRKLQAWAATCGLSAAELARLEIVLLKLLDYNLYVAPSDFERVAAAVAATATTTTTTPMARTMTGVPDVGAVADAGALPTPSLGTSSAASSMAA